MMFKGQVYIMKLYTGAWLGYMLTIWSFRSFNVFFGGTRTAFNLMLIISHFWNKTLLSILTNAINYKVFPYGFLEHALFLIWAQCIVTSNSFGWYFPLLKVASSNVGTDHCSTDWVNSLLISRILSVKLFLF